MGHKDERIVKIGLPVSLIRQLDEALIEGVGGFSTRAEFIREAIEAQLLELTHEAAPPEPEVLSGAGNGKPSPSSVIPTTTMPEPEVLHVPSGDGVQRQSFDQDADLLAQTRLIFHDGAVLDGGDAEVEDGPLFGLHNRDYPSLWAASRLAEHTADGPMRLEAFLDTLVSEGWDYASRLEALEPALGARLTALFPTNREKPQSAAEGFRAFAFGSVSRRDGDVRASGPLFAWRVCQVRRADKNLLVGLTDVGRSFLRAMNGISLATPHDPIYGSAFLAHLREFASGDWRGFQLLLSTCAKPPTREELVRAFAGKHPEWKSSLASTNAAGYVARAREWGLVEGRLIGGRYALTDFGREQLAAMASGGGVR